MPPRILDSPPVERALRLFGWARLTAHELLVLVDRPHVLSFVAPAQIDEQPKQHAQQPAAWLLQPFQLANARVRPHTHFLHEVLGIDLGPRESISRAIQHLIVLPNQRRKPLLLRRTARVDGWLSHAVTVLCPTGPKVPTRMTLVLVPSWRAVLATPF